MKKKKLILMLLLQIGIVYSITSQSVEKLDALLGKWKVENKDSYEVWEKEAKTLKGYAFKLVNGKKQISETLKISISEKDIIYVATVPDQNDGEAIPFTLNPTVQDQLSFENLLHDFPKKIQYKMIGNDKIHVHVLGENDEGFSYYLIKQ